MTSVSIRAAAWVLAGLTTAPLPPAAAPAVVPGQDWTVRMNDTFFADPDRTELRPPDEVRPRWPILPDAERERVLTDCATFASVKEVAGGAGPGIADALMVELCAMVAAV